MKEEAIAATQKTDEKAALALLEKRKNANKAKALWSLLNQRLINKPEKPDYKDKQKPDSKDMEKSGFSHPGTGAGPASLTKTISDFKQNIPYFEPLPILAGSVLLGALLIFS